MNRYDLYAIEGLTVNTPYYFTILAMDYDRNETAIAFSSAMPPKAELVVPIDDDDEDGIDPILPLLLALVALLVGLIGMVMAMKKGRASTNPTETKKEEIPDESTEEET